MKLKEGYQHAKQKIVQQIKKYRNNRSEEVSLSERDLVSLGNTIINSSEIPPPNVTSTNTKILWHSVKHNWKEWQFSQVWLEELLRFRFQRGAAMGPETRSTVMCSSERSWAPYFFSSWLIASSSIWNKHIRAVKKIKKYDHFLKNNISSWTVSVH